MLVDPRTGQPVLFYVYLSQTPSDTERPSEPFVRIPDGDLGHPRSLFDVLPSLFLFFQGGGYVKRINRQGMAQRP